MVLSLLDQLPPSLVATTTRRQVKQGAFLYHRGDAAANVFTVESGRLCLHSTTSEGTTVPLYVVYAGECVSEAALFAESYCGDVRAEIDTCVRVFPKKPLLSALGENPELAQRFMAAQAMRFNALRVRLELRNLRSARERVLQYFQSMAAPRNGEWFPHERPLKSIADDLGLSHESFYRTLARLERDGAIRRENRAIRLSASGKVACAKRVMEFPGSRS